MVQTNKFFIEEVKMPEISRFYGIVVAIFLIHSEHNPPHFHAKYGKYAIEVNINTLEVIAGEFPPTALSLLKKWAKLHQNELKEIWKTQKFKKIKPLQ